MADWAIRGGISRIKGEGTVAGTSLGTTVTAHAAAHTKGSYVELVASTTFDAQGIWVIITHLATGGVGNSFFVDIAVGAAASEQVILPNLLHAVFRIQAGLVYFFPISIPASTRISARTQAVTGGKSLEISIVLGGQGFLPSSPYGRVVGMGLTTATTLATVIDPGGTANTKGSWVEIVASTSFDIQESIIAIGDNTDPSRSTGSFLFDIGIGAGGSEVIVFPDLALMYGNAEILSPFVFQSLGLNIPAGTRIAARAQCSTTNATDRLFNVAMYGMG